MVANHAKAIASSTRELRETAFYGVFFLFLLQLLTALVESTYAISLLQTRLKPETAAGAFLLSPVLLAVPVLARRRSLVQYLVPAELTARLVTPLVADARLIIIVSGVGVAAALVLLPLLLSTAREPGQGRMVAGLVLAVTASMLMRALGSGLDFSMHGPGQLVAWGAAVAAVAGVPDTDTPAPAAARPRVRTTILATGLLAALIVIYFGFSGPQVIARWTGEPQLLVLGLLFAGWSGFAWLSSQAWFSRSLTSCRAAALTAVFILALALTVLPHRIDFPSDASAYPVFEPAGRWTLLPLAAALLLSPIAALDFALLARTLRALRPTPQELAIGFGVASVAALVAIFAQIFTTTHDYVPTIGPLFRDASWLVLLAPAAALGLSLMACRSENGPGWTGPGMLAPMVLLLGVMALGGAGMVASRPQAPADADSIRFVSWNVQQGYGPDARKTVAEQLDILKGLRPDVIALQESDTVRISGGNSDIVRFFADRLDMDSYYGPKPGAGTFGIAILSRFPIQEARTFYLFSKGEQTAAIRASIGVSGRPLHVFVTHLGNGGPMEQQAEVLSEVAGHTGVVLLGDFNFRPGSPQYQATVDLLDDAWLLRWPGGVDDSGSDHAKRIDHAFVSTGTRVLSARYVDTRASDHPALVVEIEW